jgi:predicted metal-dependent phosphoesterase TrpH
MVLRGAFDESQQRRYTHVPFEVPPGVRALHVSYDYSGRTGSDPQLLGNTLDIGLFDPRGIAASSPGFRGWSGSHKLSFSVTETWATPPYLAGPITAGTWHVLLGPYKVVPGGCEYTVEITFGADAGTPDERPSEVTAARPALAGSAESGWLRGDLHCHTLHSDGDSWPRDMLQHAVERGLDFLGVTDHNQVGHHADYARVRGADLPIVLPGNEVTTYGGHWNVWGTNTWWEFREPTEAAITQAMQAAAASGALVSINHPKAYGFGWEYPRALGYHAIEVWNGAWETLNVEALRWWDEQLRSGRRVVAVGGSDTHTLKHPESPDRLGLPTTWAYVGTNRSVSGILAALRSGRVFISRDVDGPQLYLSRLGSRVGVRAVGARGAALLVVTAAGIAHAASVATEDWRTHIEVQQPRYVRAQLMDADGQMLALTNPL